MTYHLSLLSFTLLHVSVWKAFKIEKLLTNWQVKERTLAQNKLATHCKIQNEIYRESANSKSCLWSYITSHFSSYFLSFQMKSMFPVPISFFSHFNYFLGLFLKSLSLSYFISFLPFYYCAAIYNTGKRKIFCSITNVLSN